MKNVSEDFARFIIKAMLWCFAISALIVAIVILGPKITSVSVKQSESTEIRVEAGN